MLRAVYDHNLRSEEAKRIKSVACTGFGSVSCCTNHRIIFECHSTFYGKLELDEAARQMWTAWYVFGDCPRLIVPDCVARDHFLRPPKELTWKFAGDRQEAVGYGLALRLAAAR